MGKIKATMLTLLGAAGGAAIAYFADPDRGRTRRAKTADQMRATMRDGLDTATDQLDYAAGQAKGAVAERVPTGTSEYDAKTLKHKVESEVLGHVDAPSGEIVVEARDGTVTLRGAAQTSEQIDEIVHRTSSIDGVERVENLLHLPGEPAPNIEESVEASQS